MERLIMQLINSLFRGFGRTIGNMFARDTYNNVTRPRRTNNRNNERERS